MQAFTIANLRVMAAGSTTDRICYILYPFDGLSGWIEEAAEKFGVSIAAISGMDWDDDLTPWPAKGEPPGCPDFRGRADAFLAQLKNRMMPEVERLLGIVPDAERILTGVSLSGLFTLWQWMIDDTFDNVISLSGSFWYDGFVEWVRSRPVPKKSGRAYFLLGDKEAKTNVKAFQSVQTDTVEIVNYLHAGGIDDRFDLVPGNHYQYGEQRLTRAFTWMFGKGTKS